MYSLKVIPTRVIKKCEFSIIQDFEDMSLSMWEAEATSVWASVESARCYVLRWRSMAPVRRAGWQRPSAQAQSENFSSSQLGCHPHLLEVLPPGDCILPLKIVLHLSNGIMLLHFIVLILSTFSSHFQSSWVKQQTSITALRGGIWRRAAL